MNSFSLIWWIWAERTVYGTDIYWLLKAKINLCYFCLSQFSHFWKWLESFRKRELMFCTFLDIVLKYPFQITVRSDLNGWMGNGWTQCKKAEHVKNLLNVLFLLFVFHLNLASCCCCCFFSYSIKIHSIRQVLSNPFIQLFPSLMQTRYTNDAIRCFHLIKFKLTQMRKMREKSAF